MKHIKTFENFSTNINEGKIPVQTVTYVDFDGPGWAYLGSDAGLSADAFARQIADDLNLTSGEMYLAKREFTVKGILKNGKSIEISQEGEYDMYGGPYTPKMKKPTIKIDGKDVYSAFAKEYDDYGYTVEPGNFPDATRTDIYTKLVF